MSTKRMERIIRGRRRAQGFGAISGVLTVFAILGAIYGKDMKQEAEKMAAEAQEKMPEPAKEAISKAKEKLGL